jgi:hypothetical protein
MPVIGEIGIFPCGERALVNDPADIDTGQIVLLAHLKRIGAARVQVYKLRGAPGEIGIDFSTSG